MVNLNSQDSDHLDELIIGWKTEPLVHFREIVDLYIKVYGNNDPDFIRNRQQMIATNKSEGLKHLVWKLTTPDKSGFAEIIDLYIETEEATISELASEFVVAKSTISRWRKGRVTPHPLVRYAVVRKIRTKLLAKNTKNPPGRDLL